MKELIIYMSFDNTIITPFPFNFFLLFSMYVFKNSLWFPFLCNGQI
nr:MAG TPA: hypothetical protein [Caudoviricetes sp.]